MSNSPQPQPSKGAVETAANNGNVESVLAALRGNRNLRPSPEALRAGFEQAHSKVRNGYSDQMIVDFLLSGISPSQSAEMLARKGLVGATLLASKSHTNAHIENGPVVLPEDAVVEGIEKALPRVGKGYSQEDIVRFALLSPNRSRFFSTFATNGLLKSAYLLKLAAGIEQKLSDDVMEDCFSVMEARSWNGIDRIIPDLQERLIVAQGEIPAELTPELMLEEICQHHLRFAERLQSLRKRDTDTLRRGLDGNSWNIK